MIKQTIIKIIIYDFNEWNKKLINIKSKALRFKYLSINRFFN